MRLRDITKLILSDMRWGFLRLDYGEGVYLPQIGTTIISEGYTDPLGKRRKQWRLYRRGEPLGTFHSFKNAEELQALLLAGGGGTRVEARR